MYLIKHYLIHLHIVFKKISIFPVGLVQFSKLIHLNKGSVMIFYNNTYIVWSFQFFSS